MEAELESVKSKIVEKEAELGRYPDGHLERVPLRAELAALREEKNIYLKQAQAAAAAQPQPVATGVQAGGVAAGDLVTQLAQLMLIREMVHPTLSYSSGKITQNRDPEFRKTVLQAYGYTPAECSGRSKTIPCLILDRPVPANSLVCGHIFKHEWAPVAELVMGIGIDDPGNGLPLFKPLEDAFDSLKLCITVDHMEVFTVHVLDPQLKPVRLVQRAKDLLGSQWEKPRDATLSAMTFGALNGKTIKFYTKHRPLKRLLAFHARQAIQKARNKGWGVEGLAFREFGNPGYPCVAGASQLQAWLQTQASAPAPPT